MSGHRCFTNLITFLKPAYSEIRMRTGPIGTMMPSFARCLMAAFRKDVHPVHGENVAGKVRAKECEAMHDSHRLNRARHVSPESVEAHLTQKRHEVIVERAFSVRQASADQRATML